MGIWYFKLFNMGRASVVSTDAKLLKDLLSVVNGLLTISVLRAAQRAQGSKGLHLTKNHYGMKLGFLKWHNFASHCPASLYRLAQNALHLEQFNHQLDSVINVKARVDG